MRRISEAVLSADVVPPETIRLLERWGLIGAADVAIRDDLTDALQEIERLVGLERGARRLAVLDDASQCYEVRGPHPGYLWSASLCGERLLIHRSPNYPHQPVLGMTLTWRRRDGVVQTGNVVQVDDVYEDERLVAVLCAVRHA